jgi:two-component system, response regulator
MNTTPIEILLVEDNPDDVELTLRALNAHNMANRVKVVNDGVEALEYLQPRGAGQLPNNGLPKVVLLDLKLPRVDGLEVLRRLKESEATRDIPIVVLTSSQEESDIVKSYHLGANSYIVKPVDFQQFVHAVGDLGLYWLILNKLPRCPTGPEPLQDSSRISRSSG